MHCTATYIFFLILIPNLINIYILCTYAFHTTAQFAVTFIGRAQSGKVASSGYTMAPHVGKLAQTTNRVNIDGPIPATAISLMAIFPTPATMAFGGVPTGMWNAKLHDNAAGSMRYSGWISMAIACGGKV